MTKETRGDNIPADLSIQNGFVEMAWHGNVPWHRLGNESATLMTTTEALELAGLDWPVQMGETFIRTHNGEELLMENTFGSYRRVDIRDEAGEKTGETKFVALSKNGYTATGKYVPIQNEAIFGMLDELVQEIDGIVETCGALDGGNKVWVMARLPGHIKIGGSDKDTIAPYLLLTTRHDGAGALKILPTTVRVVCSNTLGLALSGGVRSKGGITIRHTANAYDRIDQAREALGLINERFVRFGETADELANIKVTKKQAEDFFVDVLEAKPTAASVERGDPQLSSIAQRRVNELMDLHLNDKTNHVNGMKNTLWSLINSVTKHADTLELESKSDINADFQYKDDSLNQVAGIQVREEELEDGEMVTRTNKILKKGDVRMDNVASTMLGSLAKRKTMALALASARVARDEDGNATGKYNPKPTIEDAKAYLESIEVVN